MATQLSGRTRVCFFVPNIDFTTFEFGAVLLPWLQAIYRMGTHAQPLSGFPPLIHWEPVSTLAGFIFCRQDVFRELLVILLYTSILDYNNE